MPTSKWIGGCCCATALILPAVLIIVGESVIPRAVKNGIHDGIVMDSQDKMDEWLEEEATDRHIEWVFFNLTNGLALQTTSPAPKPHFELVSVEFTQKRKYFNGSVSDDGNTFSYHDWSYFVATNETDLDLEIVQVNPAYIGAVFALAPSETLLFAGLGHEILAIVSEVLLGFAASADVAAAATAAEAVLGLAAGTLASASARAAAQLGTNVFVNLGAGITDQSARLSVADVPEMQALGVCVPVELNTWMNDDATGPFAAGGLLATLLAAQDLSFVESATSVAQAQSFLTTFTGTVDPGTGEQTSAIVVLAQLAEQYAAAAAAGDDTAAGAASALLSGLFGATFGSLRVSPDGGTTALDMCADFTDPAASALCPLVALAYASYLAAYLPEAFFVGCSLVGEMRADGTGSKNSGLFTRRTVREVLFGWDEPLFSAVPASAVPEGLALEYHGLAGTYANGSSTLQDVEDAIAAGVQDPRRYAREFFSGKDDLSNNHRYVAFQGDRALTPTGGGYNHYPGWGSDGAPGGVLSIEGQRDVLAQLAQAESNSAWGMFTSGMQSEPAFGAEIEFFFDSAFMRAKMGCSADGSYEGKTLADCERHEVKGIETYKFKPAPELLLTKVGGVVNSSCGGSVSAQYVEQMAALGLPTGETSSTCEFIQRQNGLVNIERAKAAPVALSYGYFGTADAAVRDAVSITRPGEAAEVAFVAAEDEMALYFDPISGRVVKGQENLQNNFYVQALRFDSARYTNLFSATTDNGGLFAWPYTYFKRTAIIDDDDAETYKKKIYSSYTLGFALIITGICLWVFCVLLALFFCVKAKAAPKAVAPAKGSDP